MYVFMYVSVNVCKCVCMPVLMYVSVYICWHACCVIIWLINFMNYFYSLQIHFICYFADIPCDTFCLSQ